MFYKKYLQYSVELLLLAVWHKCLVDIDSLPTFLRCSRRPRHTCWVRTASGSHLFFPHGSSQYWTEVTGIAFPAVSRLISLLNLRRWPILALTYLSTSTQESLFGRLWFLSKILPWILLFVPRISVLFLDAEICGEGGKWQSKCQKC